MIKTFIITILFLVNCIHAQNVNKCDNDTLEQIAGKIFPDEMAVYRFDKYEGTLLSLRTVLSDSMDCPFKNCDTIFGQIFIKFYVLPDGKVDDIQICKGINDAIDKEVIRLIERLECIKPASIRNRPIKYEENIFLNINYNQTKDKDLLKIEK